MPDPPPPGRSRVGASPTVEVEVARRAGLSVSELHALRHLSQGPLGPADLARRLGVTTAASSGIVDRLVKHGHVQRRPHAEDGRRTEVFLTHPGRLEMVRYLAPMFLALTELDQDLSDADRAVVDGFLTRAQAAIRTLL